MAMHDEAGRDFSMALPKASAVRSEGSDRFTIMGYKPEGMTVQVGGNEPWLTFDFAAPAGAERRRRPRGRRYRGPA